MRVIFNADGFEMTGIDEIEKFISDFPVYQYAFLKPSEEDFSDDMRTYCKTFCPRYDTNWSCPPAVPKTAKCLKRCMSYDDLLLFSTVSRIRDISNLELRLDTQKDHEQLTLLIENYLKENGFETLTLTSGPCSVCKKCAFPSEYCLFPEEMHPCIESYGIVISTLADRAVMDYDMGERLRLNFTLLFFKPKNTDNEGEKPSQSDTGEPAATGDTIKLNVGDN